MLSFCLMFCMCLIRCSANDLLVGRTTDLLPSVDVCGFFSVDIIISPEINFDEFPWMALINYNTSNSTEFHCGGALISNQYVITAAHCLKGKGLPKDWKVASVRLGEHNIATKQDCKDLLGWRECSDPPVDVLVEEEIIHEDYDPDDRSQHHNIALLRLSEKVNFTDYIRPICIPVGDQLNLLSDRYNRAAVVDWGITKSGSTSDIRRKGQVELTSHQNCSSAYDKLQVNLGSDHWCAIYRDPRDACKSDSGGPLMQQHYLSFTHTVNWFITGIKTFDFSRCPIEGFSGVYTKLNGYVPWIISKLKP